MEKKLQLEEKDGKPLLETWAVATPSTFEFSALKSATQNFQYKGKLFLTNRKLLIFRGYEFELCESFSDSSAGPVKYKLKPRRINLKIPLTEIRDINVGHDEAFGRRHQIYPKLIIHLKTKTWYLILLNEGLISKKEEVQKKADHFKDRIEAIREGKYAPVKKAKPAKPVAPEPAPVRKVEPVKPVVSEPAPVKKAPEPKEVAPKPTIIRPSKPAAKPAPTAEASTAKPAAMPVATVVEDKSTLKEAEPHLVNIEKLKEKREEFKAAVEATKASEVKPAPIPASKQKSVKEILEERTEDARKKGIKFPKVAPYESSGQTYTPVGETYRKKSIKEEEPGSYTDRILEDVSEVIDMDVLDYELGASYADSSVNRCPNCGWMLTWNAKKCPKCKKDVL